MPQLRISEVQCFIAAAVVFVKGAMGALAVYGIESESLKYVTARQAAVTA